MTLRGTDMKFLVLGHGRHGKDTVGEILREELGLTFVTSSKMCSKIFIFNLLKDLLGYKTEEECFEDRHNHRELWYELIKAYNFHDKGRLCKEIMKEHDMYVGLRCDLEYQASKHLFDKILWVDAYERTGYLEPSFRVRFNHSEMIRVDNNGDEEDLRNELKRLGII